MKKEPSDSFTYNKICQLDLVCLPKHFHLLEVGSESRHEPQQAIQTARLLNAEIFPARLAQPTLKLQNAAIIATSELVWCLALQVWQPGTT